MDAPKHFYAWGFKSMGHNGVYMDFIPVIFVFALERRQMAQNMGITAAATVVPNPSLSGTCTWSKNPTSSGKGATPSGVSIANTYGRCGTLTSNGATPTPLPTTAYGGTGVSSWPTDGIVPAGTYSDVKTKANCTPAVTQVSCTTPLEVKAESEHTLSSKGGSGVDVPSSECMDVEYDWKPSNCNKDYCDPLPALVITCEVTPQFEWSQTTNAGKLGYLEITYGSTTVKSAGSANSINNQKLILRNQGTPCSGGACVSNEQTFEYSGICVDIYLSSNGTTKEPVTNKARCKLDNN
jgi:hypothetical protein